MTARHVRGLPGTLPEGEAILWQGAPCWRSLLLRMYHGGYVAAYFAVLLVATLAAELLNQVPTGTALLNEWPVLATAAATLLVLGLLAWLTAHTTEYTVTDRRVVMRFGIALSAVLAIPHGRIGLVGMKVHADHTGDIPLGLKPGSGVGAARIWPHMRPWRLRVPQPMLRGVPQAAVVGTILSRAVAHVNAPGSDVQRAAA